MTWRLCSRALRVSIYCLVSSASFEMESNLSRLIILMATSMRVSIWKALYTLPYSPSPRQLVIVQFSIILGMTVNIITDSSIHHMIHALRHFSPLSLLLLAQLLVQAVAQAVGSSPQQPLTNFKYYVFSSQCYESLLIRHNFMDTDCIVLTVSKILSYGVVVGASIVKVPQIIKILAKRSTLGVSFESVVLEEVTQISAVAYNIFRGNPFSMYGQTLFITWQMLVIHLLFIFLDPAQRIKAFLLFPPVVAFLVAAYFPQTGFFPKDIFQHMIIFQMVVFAAARLAQIYQIHKIKSTGSVSLITYGLSVLGNLARVATAMVEVKDDFKLLLSFLLAFFLNFYIVLCFFFFRKSKSKQE